MICTDRAGERLSYADFLGHYKTEIALKVDTYLAQSVSVFLSLAQSYWLTQLQNFNSCAQFAVYM